MEELTLTHPDDWHLYLRNNMGKLNLTAEIAKQLRVFHQVDIPGSKEPQLWNELFKFYENDEPAMYRIEDDLPSLHQEELNLQEDILAPVFFPCASVLALHSELWSPHHPEPPYLALLDCVGRGGHGGVDCEPRVTWTGCVVD
ncbi:hypothetical protein Tsubulata_018294 [Turnera subulata]|uniref:Uncharacterized protein n=1 Tax=Turnera subulata TaxID=218843 RepID=A0A9Q0G7P6_9ROSI|nr:hypothetical protein Tsubulata_018294 [Turnera subulata]